jgi:hypothetical protein
MLVRYEREAWVSQIDGYARLTFDRQIRSLAEDRLRMETGARGWRTVDNPDRQDTSGPMVVVELKFTSAVPRWMAVTGERAETAFSTDELLSGVRVPPEFLSGLADVLAPGATLVVTQLAASGSTTGVDMTVVTADPPTRP